MKKKRKKGYYCLLSDGEAYYCIGEMSKPKLFHRVFMRYLLGWYWVDSDKQNS